MIDDPAFWHGFAGGLLAWLVMLAITGGAWAGSWSYDQVRLIVKRWWLMYRIYRQPIAGFTPNDPLEAAWKATLNVGFGRSAYIKPGRWEIPPDRKEP